MKRVLLVVGLMAAAMVSSTAAFGQENKGWLIGGKLGPGFGINQLKGDARDLVVGYGHDDKSKVSFSLDFYGAYAFNEKLSLAAELNFMFGQGMEIDITGGYDVELTYSSLDIPVMVRYAFINKPVVFGLQAGPYLSIPFGLEMSGSGAKALNMNGKYDSAGALGGITFGAFVGYPLGPGKIVGDLRFLADFATTEAHKSGLDFTVLHRSGINLTVGYEISLARLINLKK